MDIVLRLERLESDLNSRGGSKERKCLKESQQRQFRSSCDPQTHGNRFVYVFCVYSFLWLIDSFLYVALPKVV